MAIQQDIAFLMCGGFDAVTVESYRCVGDSTATVSQRRVSRFLGWLPRGDNVPQYVLDALRDADASVLAGRIAQESVVQEYELHLSPRLDFDEVVGRLPAKKREKYEHLVSLIDGGTQLDPPLFADASFFGGAAGDMIRLDGMKRMLAHAAAGSPVIVLCLMRRVQ